VKGGKTRTVPLPGIVAAETSAHMAAFPAQRVALPWRETDGAPITVSPLVTTALGTPCNRRHINETYWKPALVKAGVIAESKPSRRYDPSCEHGTRALRLFYASVLLDAGESIKAGSEYLGHADAGFTLSTYTHLMPSSHERTRKAVDAAFLGSSESAASEIRVRSEGL
jgi:integrase